MTIAQQTDLDELYHHGVKGMKWGVRKDRKGGGRVRAASKKALSYRPAMIREKKKREKLKNELSKMSDAELRKKLDRMRQEEAYYQLNGVSKHPKSRRSMTSRIIDQTQNNISNTTSMAISSMAVATVTMGAKYVYNKGYHKKAYNTVMRRG